MVPAAKVGESVPALRARPLRFAFEDVAARVAVTVYVLVVVPSSAVTTVVIVFEPTESAMEPEALPEVTVVPLTLIVALESAAVGVTVRLVVALGTLTA